jgi:Protein of unknown function (DUF295)
MSERMDWLNLPIDLISEITKKLPDICDFARARAVCKTWGSIPLSSAPPQFPWVLEWKNSIIPVLERDQRFYSLFSGEIGTISVEESHWGKKFRGHCRDYLPLLAKEGVSLFNPLTRAEISFPPISIDYHWPIWISANRTANEVMFVSRNVYEQGGRGIWAYHHPDSNEWVSVKGIFKSCCYYDGMLFCTEEGEDTKVFDVNSKKILHEIPPPENEIALLDSEVSVTAHIVESSEEILRVSWNIDWLNGRVEKSVFHLHLLDFQGEKERPRWIKINSIGDRIIFLEESNGFSISAKPFAGFRGNCIYFINRWLKKPHRYDIETGTVEKIPCPFARASWFLPSLQ